MLLDFTDCQEAVFYERVGEELVVIFSCFTAILDSHKEGCNDRGRPARGSLVSIATLLPVFLGMTLHINRT